MPKIGIISKTSLTNIYKKFNKFSQPKIPNRPCAITFTLFSIQFQNNFFWIIVSYTLLAHFFADYVVQGVKRGNVAERSQSKEKYNSERSIALEGFDLL